MLAPRQGPAWKAPRRAPSGRQRPHGVAPGRAVRDATRPRGPRTIYGALVG